MPYSFLHSARELPTNWDDLRHVLAVAETGSVSAAARLLGVNHATVLRRIAAFEAALGTTLFERGRNGYAVLPDQFRVIDAAREAAAAIEAVQRLARGAEARLSGTLRITSTDSLCATVLPGVIAEVMAQADGLRIDLVSTNTHLDLARLGADISIRPTRQLPDDLVGEVAGELGFGIYAAAGTRPAACLGLRGVLARSVAAEALAVPAGECTAGADSFVILREMAAAGLGRTILPCPLGEGDPRLERIGTPLPGIRVPIWVATHRDLAETPRLRLLRRRITAALESRAPVLTGPDTAAGPGAARLQS